MRVTILRNLGAADNSLPLHLRKGPDAVKEGQTVDLDDADAQLLIERKLAEPEAPPVMRATAFARAPESPEAKKAREAREQKQRDEAAALDLAEHPMGVAGPEAGEKAKVPEKKGK